MRRKNHPAAGELHESRKRVPSRGMFLPQNPPVPARSCVADIDKNTSPEEFWPKLSRLRRRDDIEAQPVQPCDVATKAALPA